MSSGKKDGWGSSLGVILAVTGSAVGLGNFLRFPARIAFISGSRISSIGKLITILKP